MIRRHGVLVSTQHNNAPVIVVRQRLPTDSSGDISTVTRSGARRRLPRPPAVFSMDSAGLMYEATLGGQKFSYLSKDAVE